MPTTYRRGGTYRRNGKTFKRRGGKVKYSGAAPYLFGAALGGLVFGPTAGPAAMALGVTAITVWVGFSLVQAHRSGKLKRGWIATRRGGRFVGRKARRGAAALWAGARSAARAVPRRNRGGWVKPLNAKQRTARGVVDFPESDRAAVDKLWPGWPATAVAYCISHSTPVRGCAGCAKAQAANTRIRRIEWDNAPDETGGPILMGQTVFKRRRVKG